MGQNLKKPSRERKTAKKFFKKFRGGSAAAAAAPKSAGPPAGGATPAVLELEMSLVGEAPEPKICEQNLKWKVL